MSAASACEDCPSALAHLFLQLCAAPQPIEALPPLLEVVQVARHLLLHRYDALHLCGQFAQLSRVSPAG
jgi:hypothetical protein